MDDLTGIAGAASPKARAKNAVKRALRARGLVVRRPYPTDFSPELIDICERTSGYTTSTWDRVAALHGAAEHVTRNKIPGAVVETGVWRGGSMMVAALALLGARASERELYLFDTFQGMPSPGEKDGRRAAAMWHRTWMSAGEEGVRRAMESTGYPAERIHLVKGLVEETVPARAPEELALLRIDTDFYSPVRHALEHLYPRLQSGGILIIDDYGAWEGARRAVDEYFDGSVYLHRIDYTARAVVKV
jgi:hypothetical protein